MDAHLADVHVVAVCVELRVVLVENGGVHAVGLGNVIAGCIGDDDVGRRAVGAYVAEAEDLTRLEIVTTGVDARVDLRKLVAAEGKK